MYWPRRNLCWGAQYWKTKRKLPVSNKIKVALHSKANARKKYWSGRYWEDDIRQKIQELFKPQTGIFRKGQKKTRGNPRSAEKIEIGGKWCRWLLQWGRNTIQYWKRLPVQKCRGYGRCLRKFGYWEKEEERRSPIVLRIEVLICLSTAGVWVLDGLDVRPFSSPYLQGPFA